MQTACLDSGDVRVQLGLGHRSVHRARIDPGIGCRGGGVTGSRAQAGSALGRDFKLQTLGVNLPVVHHPNIAGDLGGNFGKQIVEFVVEAVGCYRNPGAKVLLQDELVAENPFRKELDRGRKKINGVAIELRCGAGA